MGSAPGRVAAFVWMCWASRPGWLRPANGRRKKMGRISAPKNSAFAPAAVVALVTVWSVGRQEEEAQSRKTMRRMQSASRRSSRSQRPPGTSSANVRPWRVRATVSQSIPKRCTLPIARLWRDQSQQAKRRHPATATPTQSPASRTSDVRMVPPQSRESSDNVTAMGQTGRKGEPAEPQTGREVRDRVWG